MRLFIDKDIRMKELTVRECEAVSGSGLADLFRPGKNRRYIDYRRGNRFWVWIFSVYDREVHWRNDQNSFLMLIHT